MKSEGGRRGLGVAKLAGVAIGALFGASGAFAGNYLMVPNFSTSGRSIMLFNKSDGSLVNKNFIVGDANNVLQTPREAIQVGNQVWICDQVANKVFRYDFTTGGYLPAITGDGTTSFNNLRGMELVGNSMYVTNAGSGFGNAVVKIDVNTLAVTTAFTLNQTNQQTPWDVQSYQGGLLVTNYSSSTQTGISRIDRYDLSGNFVGNFYTRNNNTGSSLLGPQQVTVESNGNLLVGGFLGTTNTAVYELDSSGNVLNTFAGGTGPRSGFRLGNGNIMYTKGDGVWSWDPVAGTGTALLAQLNVINANFISETTIPTPGSAMALGVGGLLALRRRR
jgi:hypothetical protein